MKKTIKLKIDGSEVIVEAERSGDTLTIDRGDTSYTVELVRDEMVRPAAPPRTAPTAAPSAPTAAPATPAAASTAPAPAATSAAPSDPGGVPAPMTGTIKTVLVTVGASVQSGDQIIMMEAMKMDIEVAAPRTGTVKEIYVSTGDSVKEGQPLLSIG